MAKSKGMTENQLASLVRSEIDDAIGYDESEISVRRAKALDYYNGDMPDVPAEDGRSAATSHDVSDVIGWILPGLMRTFLGSDNVVTYEPQKPQDEPFAKQATDYINYVFLRECDGYRVLYDACWEGLLFGNGVIKHWWDTTPRYTTEDFSGLNDAAYTMLAHDKDVKVLQFTKTTEIEQVIDPATGQATQQESEVYDCKIRRTTSHGRICIKALAPEEFLIERYAVSIDDARFLCHRRQSSHAELIAEGFDRDKVMAIGSDTALQNSPTKIERWEDAIGDTDTVRNSDDPLMQEVEVFEAYIKTDFDGDGHPEWRKVVMAGSGGVKAILANDEWGDEVPFSDLVPEPRPHRWDGRSVYDEVQDLQRIKTALTRQTLDNLYLTNHPQRSASPTNVKNADELQSPSLGGVVWADDPNAIVTLDIPFVAGNSFQMLEYLDMVMEKRTGVSKQSSVLDGNELQNQTATAAQIAFDSNHAKQELYSRNIAEIGLKRLFKCVLKLIVKHQDEPRTIRLRDQWVQMDPRSWNADMDAVVNVGLGTGSRDRDLKTLMMISGEQKAIMQAMGPVNPIVRPSQYVATLHKMVEAAGLKSPEMYFSEISPDMEKQMEQQAQQAATKPDPKMQIEQMKAATNERIQMSEERSNATRAQAEAAKAAADARVKIIEADAKMREADLKIDLANRQMELDALKATQANGTTIAKAAIDNLVKLEIARITASKDTDTKPDAVEARLSSDAGI